jgi:hypothetical protein
MPQGFPNNPAVNDTALLNGSQYEWDGVAWRKTAASTATADLTDYATIVSLATETTRATAAEGTNTTDIATNATAIATETTRATAAEGVNATAIAAETTRATAAEGTNTTDIATITAAMSTDTERLAAVTALTTAYDAADTTLEGLLTTAIAGKLSTSGGTMTGNLTMQGNEIFLSDNGYIRFGNSEDLQIWHDGSDSVIKDQGTGNLKICSDNLYLRNAADTETTLRATENGSLKLYYDNAEKLATTSTGIDVTGTVTATSVKVGSWTVTDTGGELMFNNGTNRMKLDASGNLTVTGDITAFGSV